MIPFKITELWVAIASESDDDEGVPAMQIGHLMFPLIAADASRFQWVLMMAEDLSRKNGKKIKVVKFTQMEIVKEFKPV